MHYIAIFRFLGATFFVDWIFCTKFAADLRRNNFCKVVFRETDISKNVLLTSRPPLPERRQ